MDWELIGKLAREAFQEAVNDWLGKARIQGGNVFGPNAALTPGSLVSHGNIEASLLQKLTGSRVPPEIATALSRELAGAWNTWASAFQMQMPGAYPAFAAFPGPVAPPTPAPPLPLAQGFSAGEASLKAGVLAARLHAALRMHIAKAPAGSGDQAVKRLAEWIDSSFQEWKAVTRLVGILGRGNVPTFAPPYVPVGPVAMGDNLSAGPVFAGPRFGRMP